MDSARPPSLLALATGRAVCTIIGRPELTEEVALYAEACKSRLALDGAHLSAAIMFVQPLLTMWASHWKFAYTIAISLGVKYCDDGFFLSDIIDHVTDEFELDALIEGEAAAVLKYDWTGMNRRFRSFRNALVWTALNHPEPEASLLPSLCEDGTAGTSPSDCKPIRVLIVDSSPEECRRHQELLHRQEPSAIVHVCRTVEAALEFQRWSEANSVQVHLVLVESILDADTRDAIATKAPNTVEDVLAAPNGFDVAHAMDICSDGCTRTDFLYKPLVAMVTSLADAVEVHANKEDWVEPDGSMNGCDAMIAKPLTPVEVRLLLEACSL